MSPDRPVVSSPSRLAAAPAAPFVAGLVAAFLVGCGSPSAPAPSGEPAASRYALAQDPGGGSSVLEAIAAAPRDDVVVVGRVARIAKDYAAFTLADTSLAYCGETEMPDCETPWDYCCVDSALVAAGSLAVAALDATGDVAPLASIPELRPLDLVAVRGRLEKTEAGDVRLVATGWHRRERPVLPAHVKWPE